MSDSIPTSVEAAVRRLGELSEKLSVRCDMVDATKKAFCESAVDRNASMASVSTPDTEAEVQGAVFRLSIADGRHVTQLDATIALMDEISTDALKIGGEVVAAAWRLEAEVKSLQNALALAQADARAREHPQNRPDIRRQVWEMTGGECFYCRSPLKHPTDTPASDLLGGVPSMHVDHIVPKDAGGPDHICNYVPACQSCNSTKSAKPFVEFYEAVVGMKREGLKVVGASE